MADEATAVAKYEDEDVENFLETAVEVARNAGQVKKAI